MYALAAQTDPWWMSATSPWWAAPVATLAGAFLAWFLARLTSNRAERREDAIALREKKLEVYDEFWAAGMEYSRATSHDDVAAGTAALLRTTNLMLRVELFSPPEVNNAAREVVRYMSGKETSSERVEAMKTFRERVTADIRR